MLPVDDAGDDDIVEVSAECVPRLRRGRRVLREAGADVAGADVGRNGEPLDAFDVLGDPVDQFMAAAPELVSVHPSTPARGASGAP